MSESNKTEESKNPQTIIDLEPIEAPVLFAERQNAEQLIAQIRERALSFVADHETAQGRKTLISVAASVSRVKTHLDGLGKKEIEDKQQYINGVNAIRKYIRDESDKLRDEVRMPVTRWEKEQEEKAQRKADRLATIKGYASSIPESDDPEPARQALADVEEFVTENDEEVEAVSVVKKQLQDTLDLRIFRQKEKAEQKRKQEEEERKAMIETRVQRINGVLLNLKEDAGVELIRDRIDVVKNMSDDSEKSIAEAAETTVAALQDRLTARIEADKEAAEEKRKAAEAEQQRKIKEAQEIAEKQAAEAAERAKEEAERKIKAAEEAERKRERERIEAEEKKRKEAEQRKADEDHRERIEDDAAAGFAAYLKIDMDDARNIVEGIANGQIANIKIEY